jgi:hypothetical protein
LFHPINGNPIGWWSQLTAIFWTGWNMLKDAETCWNQSLI